MHGILRHRHLHLPACLFCTSTRLLRQLPENAINDTLVQLWFYAQNYLCFQASRSQDIEVLISVCFWTKNILGSNGTIRMNLHICLCRLIRSSSGCSAICTIRAKDNQVVDDAPPSFHWYISLNVLSTCSLYLKLQRNVLVLISAIFQLIWNTLSLTQIFYRW